MESPNFFTGIHRLSILIALVLIQSVGLSAAKGLLQVNAVNASGEATAFRAWIEQAGNQLFTPDAPNTATPYPRDRSFSCDGWFEIALNPGPAVLHVEKGKEWLPQEIELTIEEGKTTELTVTLSQWIDMQARGYLSGDLHIHFGNDNPRILHQLAQADDLDVMPAFSIWLRGTEPQWRATWPSVPSSNNDVIPNSDAFVTRNNLEIERIFSSAAPGGSVGASFLYNLRAPISVPHYDTRFPTDTDLCLLARATSPHVVIDTDKPSWGETVVGAILGVYDTAQVCHNHYHRRQTLPGGWGMIGPLDASEDSLRNPNELFHRTNKQYYSFLNCGIHMGVSGGSAIGVMPVPAGYNRVYARVAPPFTNQKFWTALKQGKSFATSGPLLFLKVADQSPGGHIAYTSSTSHSLPIHVDVQSIEALKTVEIIHNGNIIRQVDLSQTKPTPSISTVFEFQHYPTRSGWYAARVQYEAPMGQLRQAHTSPIYLTVDSKPTAFAADARYLIRWIDELVSIAEERDRFQQPGDQAEVIATYQRARAAYQNVLSIAQTAWSDESPARTR